MHGRRNQSPGKLAVDVGRPTMLDWNRRRILARRTLIVAFLCLTYVALCLTYVALGSVIWGAYHKFGDRPLPNEAPLITADATPVKLVPRTQPRDAIALAPSIGDRPAAAGSPRREPLVAAAGPPSAPMQLPDGSRGAPPASLAQAEQTEPMAPVAHPSAKAGAAGQDGAWTGQGDRAQSVRTGGVSGAACCGGRAAVHLGGVARTCPQAARRRPGGSREHRAERRRRADVARRRDDRAARAGAEAGHSLAAAHRAAAGAGRAALGGRPEPARCPAGLVGEREDPAGVRSGAGGPARRR